MPPNATDVISQLRSLIELEFIPNDRIMLPISDFFGVSEEEGEDDEGADDENDLDPYAYPSSKSGLLNMGFMLSILLANICISLLVLPAVRVCTCNQKCLVKI